MRYEDKKELSSSTQNALCCMSPLNGEGEFFLSHNCMEPTLSPREPFPVPTDFRKIHHLLSKELKKDYVRTFFDIKSPPQSIICLGIAFCKIVSFIRSCTSSSNAEKIDKQWLSLKKYISSIKFFDEKFSPSTSTDFSLKGYIGKIKRIYLAGSDMNERKLGVINKNAAQIFALLKSIEALACTKPAEPDNNETASWMGKSITVLLENDKSKKVINYKLKTDIKDSPTKRLISMKRMHSNDHSISIEKIVPKQQIMPKSRIKPRSVQPSRERSRESNNSIRRTPSTANKKEFRYSDHPRYTRNRPQTAYNTSNYTKDHNTLARKCSNFCERGIRYSVDLKGAMREASRPTPL